MRHSLVVEFCCEEIIDVFMNKGHFALNRNVLYLLFGLKILQIFRIRSSSLRLKLPSDQIVARFEIMFKSILVQISSD